MITKNVPRLSSIERLEADRLAAMNPKAKAKPKSKIISNQTAVWKTAGAFKAGSGRLS